MAVGPISPSSFHNFLTLDKYLTSEPWHSHLLSHYSKTLQGCREVTKDDVCVVVPSLALGM